MCKDDVEAHLVVSAGEGVLLVHLPVEDGHGDVHGLFELARAESGDGEAVVVGEDEIELETVVNNRVLERVRALVDVADCRLATNGEDSRGDVGVLDPEAANYFSVEFEQLM